MEQATNSVFSTSSYQKQPLKTNPSELMCGSQMFNYNQACALLQAIELNGRKRLSKKCVAHLAVFVLQAWEDKICQEKIQRLYCMMNNLLDTTGMDPNEPFEISLQNFCQNSISIPSICPSITLLVAISYVERLNKRYRDLKGTPGCGFRIMMVAYIMAAKYIHRCLQLIIYTNSRQSNNTTPITPPTSPKIMSGNASLTYTNNSLLDIVHDDRNIRIKRMEQEFLCFLNHDLSVQDTLLLVYWARTYDNNDTLEDKIEDNYTSADEGDDEMDEEEL
ncbi:uncharacterized protein BX663DRAFT_505798 [Cokeromyces recurvatus]|uniref:uncharacterized protein n=1 Tax=Cokeromyces recurvatus TaxID=90255 RepID=UPI0022205C4A|nr:uncharacterized protein BX663DRAFT_505798 [Cokeromyces recurvatus]KAI7903942.1 hypothetical protein BX663DRAFT_505798 [Cokeromyces recurvatus]